MGLQDLKNPGNFLKKGARSLVLSFRNSVLNAGFILVLTTGNFACTDGVGESDLGPEPQVVVTPETPLVTPREIRGLRQKLLQQQIKVKKDLKRGHDEILREMVIQHKTHYKEWSSTEKENRKKFFSENPDGKVRRLYVKDFLHRREELVQRQKQEVADLKKSQAEETAELESSAQEKRREAEAYFREKRKPSFLELSS